jgi:hypothetical protein
MKLMLLCVLSIFSLAGCEGKHQEHKISTAGNFRVMSPWYSFGEKYQMVVYKNNSLIILDAHKRLSDSQTLIRGTWSVDEQNKTVSISLNDKTDSYIFFEPIHASAAILVKGSLENANLSQSWFSVFIEEPDEPESKP